MFATSTRCPSGDVKPQLIALILVSELRACGECAWKGGPGLGVVCGWTLLNFSAEKWGG